MIVNNHAITIVILLKLSKFKYTSNYMLIYIKFLKPSDHLRYFTCGFLNACSTYSVHNFMTETKLYILEQIIDFRKNVNNEQKCHMCNKANVLSCQKIFSFHMCTLVHSISVEFELYNLG